ncbi:MAG: tetratricopeptide repeat protein [Candidatus Eisenbacteria bacterium]
MNGPWADWSARLRRWFGLAPATPKAILDAQRAGDMLGDALAEDDPALRVEKLREALAHGEQMQGESGDIVVMEASLHLGEKLRTLGSNEEALLHFGRAVERSYRVPDPVGRHRRAGVLSRLAILDQEAGQFERAKQRYEEALQLGGDSDAQLLLGMLTQAAFNLGILESESGDAARARVSWERAIQLGARSGHPSGWDPAAVAAFNLGHLFVRDGSTEAGRRMLEQVSVIGEPAGTPLGLMASAKAALALATLAEQEGLPGGPEATRQYRRALEFGRACAIPEGRLAALQGAIGLGEEAAASGRMAEAVGHYRTAHTLAPSCEPHAAARFGVLCSLRLGQALAETTERDEAAIHLQHAFLAGRESDETWVREWAGQAACNRHRVLCALDRWEEARALAEEALAFTSTLDSGLGRALEAAALYARAFQQLHDGDSQSARAALSEVTTRGLASGVEVGERIALDALMLSGHLDRQAGRAEPARAAFKQVVSVLRGRHGPDADAMAAMASVNLGHALVALERQLEARYAYEQALERGRTCGLPAGRAAAANAALNLGAMREDELTQDQRRELFTLAGTLGRSSGTALGTQCAAQSVRAIAQLESGEEEGEDGSDEEDGPFA